MRIVLDARKLEDFGIGRYIRALLSGLPVHMLADRHEPIAICRPQQRELLSTRYRDWRVEVVDAASYSLAEQWRVPIGLRRVEADLYHSPHYAGALWTSCRRLVTVHDVIHLLYPENIPSMAGILYARVVMARAVSGAHTVLTVSEATRSELFHRYGTAAAPIVITPNGVNPQTETDDCGLVETLCIEGEYILFVGNPKPHKNLERLLRAFERVHQADVSLVLVGAPLPSALAPLAPPGRVLTLGFVEESTLWQLYRHAQMLVIPSIYEGFGLPALEAMAVGTPVIASGAGGLQEVVGDAALIVDPYDVEALTESMERLLADDALHAKLAEAGRRRSAMFTWEGMVRQTYDCYRLVLEGSGR